MLRCTALLALLFCFAAAGCDTDEPDFERTPPTADGLAYAESGQSVDSTFSALDAALQAASPVSVVARIDHAQNAEGAGLELRPTRVILFGNPTLGTPLMQADQRAGIDLPQKILVHEGADGRVYASYNTTGYLAARHAVDTVSTLPQIGGALQMFTENTTGGTVEALSAEDVDEGEGLVEVESDFSVDETFERLQDAVEAAGPLTVMAQLDHAANAASVGLDLRPTRLLVFGNPNLGTPLMQSQQSIGIDLPQKVLVYEDADGTVRLAYNDPFYLAERHGVAGQDETLQTIADALEGLAQTATQAENG